MRQLKKKYASSHQKTRLNINSATAQMIADHIKGIGFKKLRKKLRIYSFLYRVKDSIVLDQLKQIKRVDWDSVFAADLVRV